MGGIVIAQAEAGFRDNALAASGAMPEVRDRLVAFSTTALATKDEQLLNELSTYSLRYIGENRSIGGVLSILDTLAKTGHTVAALSVVEAIEEDLFRAAALGTIGAASGDLDLVLSALRIVQTTETASSEFVRSLTLGRFPIFLLKAGGLQEALSLVASLESDPSRQSHLASISVHLAQNGRFEEAIEIANRIASVEFESLNLSLSLDQERAFAEIIISLAMGGHLDEALRHFQDFESGIWYERVSAELAIVLALANRHEEAVAIVSAIKTEPFLSFAQAGVAIGLAKNGAVSEALAHVQAIDEIYDKARGFAEIALPLE
ncbi:MAG TPA: hypothetical protein EYG79_10365 [Rhodobacteraceae bacterium]|nr:hypothetical protein [Paracoccaceae bacterium]